MATIFPERRAQAKLESITWSTDLTGSLSWTVDGVSAGSGATITTLFATDGVTHRIAVTNGTATVFRDIKVAKVLAYKPSYTIKGRFRGNTLKHLMADGQRRGRVKRREIYDYELQFKNREVSELVDVLNDYVTYKDLAPFAMTDPVLNVSRTWYFDSEPVWEYGGHGCTVNYSFRALEA